MAVVAAGRRHRGVPREVVLLLAVVVLEVGLFGGGRLLQVGPLTVRMYLYTAVLAYMGADLLHRRMVDREAALLLVYFAAITAGGAALGLVNGASVSDIAADLKPQSFFLILPFFVVAIRDEDTVRLVATLLRGAGLVLAVGYLLIVALIRAKVIPQMAFYILAGSTGEVFFRGDTGLFFYKGFLYLGVAFFLYATRAGWWAKAAAALLLAALVLTLTRGFIVSLVITTGVWVALRGSRAAVLSFAAVVLLVIAVFWALGGLDVVTRVGSDMTRVIDARLVWESVTPVSLLVGHGLGIDIGTRGLHIEPTYLELLHKQGVLGLALWGVIAALLVRDMRRACTLGRDRELLPFFLASVFVYVQTATNPFLTNPIGMCPVLLALAAGRVATGRGRTTPLPAAP